MLFCRGSLIVTLLVLAIGCTEPETPPVNPVPNDPISEPINEPPFTEPAPSETGPTENETASSDQPPLKVEAADFWASFKSDPQQFAEKYGDKTVEIHGTAHAVAEEFPGQTLVALKTDDLVGIVCRFDNDPQPWATVVPGQEVTLRGKCPNKDFLASNAVIEQCEFVSVGPGPEAKPAAELAKQYAANREGAWDVFQKQTLVVTGKVRSLEEKGSAKVLVLEGIADADVECWFDSKAAGQVADVKAGDDVKVIGELIASTGDDERNFPLSKCLLITKPSAVER